MGVRSSSIFPGRRRQLGSDLDGVLFGRLNPEMARNVVRLCANLNAAEYQLGKLSFASLNPPGALLSRGVSMDSPL